MLILTRRPTESIIIGDDIRITIREINGRQVRIAIDAPKHIRVDREEFRLQKMSHPSDGGSPPIDIAAYDLDPRN